MSPVLTALLYAFRKYVVDGMPASGVANPSKDDIETFGRLLETALADAAGNLIGFATVALRDADTSQADGQLAYVWNNNGEADDPANGVYQWDDGGAEWVAADWYFQTIVDLVVPLAAGAVTPEALAAIAAARAAALTDIGAAGDAEEASITTLANARKTEILQLAPSQGPYNYAHASALPREIVSATITNGGSGGTPGVYALGVTGGSFTGVAGTFTVNGSGVVSAIDIPVLTRGLNLTGGTTLPTLSFPGAGSLTGVVAAAVSAPIVGTGKTYLAESADGKVFYQWRNDGTSTPAPVLDSNGVQRAYISKAGFDALIKSTLATRSGFIAGIQSLDGQLLLGFHAIDGRAIFGVGGDLAGRITSVEGALNVVDGGRSGILAGIKLPNGMLPFAIEQTSGRALIDGRALAVEVDALKASVAALTANPLPDFPIKAAACFGNSMTGTGLSSGNWPEKLAASTGMPIYNGGQGGQGGLGIAGRQGGLPPLITLSGNSIPGTVSPVTVTAIVGTPCAVSSSATVTIAGVVGTLTRDSGSGHTFTRASAGSATAVPARSPVTVAEGQSYRDRILIAEIAANSVSPTGAEPMSISQVIGAYRAMIDFLTPRIKRVIIWSSAPNTSDSGPVKASKTAFNNAVAAAFPEFWLDLMGWMRTTAPATVGSTTVNDPFTVTGITPTAQDLIDIGNGDTPSSFRQTGDGIHFNDPGGTAAEYRIRMELQIKGYI